VCLELVVFEMIPDLFVGVPVRRVLRKIENVQAILAGDESLGLLGNVRRGLIHDHDKMASKMMAQHLPEELDDLRGGNPFLVEAKE
jgi:hypothetical protein